ncbi:MAG: hypothetical protein JWQ81_2703 [Amycolatopsis sp.]|uniref:hypothetical protein n=1 Tax=Amycolatopsis sp. TaxID=37632 RepID=UPI00260D8C40|nr:hypothetical protein [Amycolatopsis sp.]MCU1681964.1 hypothetical protein [Amycolatopsis sp.]
MPAELVFQTVFELCLTVLGSVVTSLCALAYLRRVRLERPAIGVFNGRDIAILVVFLAILPTIYVGLPRWATTGLLMVTFTASLSIGYRPLLAPGRLWLGIGLLLGANIWLGQNMLGTVFGWQLFWAEGDIIMLLGAVSVANLYVQGGMRLRHVAWFALALAVYDMIFTAFVPLTNALVEDFLGYPLDPSMGMRIGFYNAAIGLGDLLIYALFLISAYKAYGWRAARVAMVLIVLFGCVVPSLAPLLINFIDARADIVVPVQTWFGPVAFLGYLWMRRRYGRERTMREFLADNDAVKPTPADVVAPAVVPESASVS